MCAGRPAARTAFAPDGTSVARAQTMGPVSFQGEAVDMSCEVALEGHNVAEGLRALVEAGHAQAPLPDFLLQLPHALGSNLSDNVSAEQARAARNPALQEEEGE